MQMTKRGAPSGKNKAFAERVKQVDCAHLQPVNCELTLRDSQQFNSLAKTAFPYLAACARAMMGGANIPVKCRKQIVIEALKTITMLDGLVMIKLGGKLNTRDSHCFGGNLKCAAEMRTFGEAAVV